MSCLAGPMLHKNILSIKQFSKEDLISFIEYVAEIKNSPPKNALAGKVLATLFFEPSTRTRLSFEVSMKRLGGSVVGLSEEYSSLKKGESLSDTIRVIGDYSDAIVIRHPSEGSALLASQITDVPIINGGDGKNQHPTQTLIDLFSLSESQGSLEGLSIGIYGDLKHARTIHSLTEACALFGMRMYFICPEGFELPEEVVTHLKRSSIRFSYHREMDPVLPKLDALYVTRLQRERFSEGINQLHEQLRPISLKMLKGKCKEHFKILHPLPRDGEILEEVDSSPYAYYFQQSKNGVAVRQALLLSILGN